MDENLEGAGQSTEMTNHVSDRQEPTGVPPRDPGRRAKGPRTATGKQRSSQNARTHGVFLSSILLKDESKTEFRSMLYGMREYFQPEGEMENLLVEKLSVISWRDRRVLRAECAGIEKERTALVENAVTQRIQDDRTKVLGIRWDGPNSITLKRAIDLLNDLRSNIKGRGFDKEEDFPVLVTLYSATDDGVPDGIFFQYVCCMESAELYSRGGDPKMGTGVPLEKAKEIIDKFIEEEIKTLGRIMDWVTRREAELLEYTNVASLVPTQAMLDRLTKYETNLSREFERTLHQLERLQKMRRGQPVAPPINVQISG
jgi:hypothetical protein